MILAGDVGGTKTNLALYGEEGRRIERRDLRSYPSRAYPSLEAILEEYLEASGSKGTVSRACLGLAGPVIGGRSRLTNLPWTVEPGGVRRACGAEAVFLLNDLQATAFAVPALPPGSLAPLQEGEPDPAGVVAVIAAGTGLGTAFLVPRRGGHIPVAAEGGHADFAPRDEFGIRLLRHLSAVHGRVSVERVLSGPGLYALYRFLREVEGMPESPEVAARLSAADPPRAVSREGLAGTSPACAEALRRFAAVYGAQAGDLALQVLATGGVYLGGGIAPAILPALEGDAFLEAFRGKGRFRDLLARIPVRVILDDKAALLGAARYALAGGEETG